jgi:hypothetical protein
VYGPMDRLADALWIETGDLFSQEEWIRSTLLTTS